MGIREFYIADFHAGHKKIIDYEHRPFRDCAEMEETIIKNWNSVVRMDDIVMVLGDVSFYPKEITKKIIEGLNGRKFLITGNHDGHSLAWWQSVGFVFVSKWPILRHKWLICSHEPIYLEKNTPYRNIHGHIHGNRTLSDKHFNVSVENINYTPILLSEILKVIAPNDEAVAEPGQEEAGDDE